MKYLTISGFVLAAVFLVLYKLEKKKKDKALFNLENLDTSMFLYDITFSDDNFMEKLKNISAAIMKRLDFDYVSFFILDPNNNVGIITSNVPEYDRTELNLFTQNLLLNKDTPLILHSNDSYLQHGKERYIKYAYFVPLKDKGETIGGILLERESNKNIEKIESMVFETIVTAASKAFAFIIFAYNLNESAYKDVLTGTQNRKALDNYDETLDDTYTAVMCDIDFFKKVNDTYGHDAGDEVIKLMANLLLKSVRLGDVVIRWGGEEFLMLLKGVDCNKIISRINDVRRSIEEHTIIYDNKQINITASFGLCDTSHSHNLHELQKAADKALYYSKNNGRNISTVYREGM